MEIAVPFLVRDREIGEQVARERVVEGADRFDEVWDGTYIVMVQPNNEHQYYVGDLSFVFSSLVRSRLRGKVLPGTNVSDRVVGWKTNYRCPDIAVVLEGGKAVDHDTFWFGGPDFLVEVVSEDDGTREKIPFYSKIQVRELLIVERDPWRLELLRHDGVELKSVGIATADNGVVLTSEALGITFRMSSRAQERPLIEIRTLDGQQSWQV